MPNTVVAYALIRPMSLIHLEFWLVETREPNEPLSLSGYRPLLFLLGSASFHPPPLGVGGIVFVAPQSTVTPSS